ncbi:class I SAM-dependent methyltransferase [Candidatus Kaiserbacteria bacterium]|nr:class I SAM-dependent methyltransferase [Candidatus Kaiserbacteria bacterium]MCB9812582.1 class I SAM-dependent methyltransferase [Candidatus Nomurabacteria bacterium]
MNTETINEKTLVYRKKAVASHDMNSPVFFDRYTVLDEDPYASAFAYGRKKLFAKMDKMIDDRLKGEGQVLELACGTGYYLKHLREKGYTMTGLEPAEGMRARAKEKNPGVEIKEGVVNALPFPDNSFDAVVSVELFRYLEAEDIKKGYEEVLRVLKPGGFMVVTLVNRYALDAFQFSYQAKLLMEKLFGKQIINYCDSVTPAGMRRYFKQHFNQDAETASALFAPLRIIYKISPKLGSWCARKLEHFDERLNEKVWHQKFAGHLIVLVEKK